MKEATDKHDSNGSEVRDLERVLGACRPEKFDNTRIKALVHQKMRVEELARRSRMRRRAAAWLSVAACAVFVVAAGLAYMGGRTPDRLSDLSGTELAEAGCNELSVGVGERKQIVLPDGSRLIANAGTRVVWPESFDGEDVRRIYASGEVFLEVAKDPEHPFIVESQGFEVKVLGTTFNICNMSDSTAAVVLVEGRVEVSTGSDESVRMAPDDMLELCNGNIASLRKVDTSDYTAWTRGLLALHGIELGELSAKLSRYYGVEVVCDESLSDVRIYGKLDLRDSIGDVLGAISDIVPMKIEHDGSKISLRADRNTMK